MAELSDTIPERKQLNITLNPGNRKKLEAIRFYENKDYKKLVNEWIEDKYIEIEQKYGHLIKKEKEHG